MFENWRERRRLGREKKAEAAAAAAEKAARLREERAQEAKAFQDEISQPDYAYRYSYQGDEYRINVADGRVYLKSSGIAKIYPLQDLRDIARRWIIPEQYTPGRTVGRGYNGNMHAIGANIGSSIVAAQKNKLAKRAALEESGLIISVADVEHPIFHIHFPDQPSLLRSFETLRQAMEGRLPHKQHNDFAS